MMPSERSNEYNHPQYVARPWPRTIINQTSTLQLFKSQILVQYYHIKVIVRLYSCKKLKLLMRLQKNKKIKNNNKKKIIEQLTPKELKKLRLLKI